MKKIIDSIKMDQLVLFFLIFVSTLVFVIYLKSGANLAYGDSVSRLNIARKITDNLTPGIGQLGNVWLAFPQILMVPFTLSTFMWHSGIAGALVSMPAYIIGGYFIYKLSFLLTKSKFGTLIALIIYGLNINLLYMQTTAMSEPIFIMFFSGILYFLVSWVKTQKFSDLMFSAILLSGITLTRYEGLSLLLASISLVGVCTYLKTKSWAKTEGNLVIFSTLACLGFALWTLYLTIIFGDPLYWLHFYASPQSITAQGVALYTQNISWLSAALKYITSMVWMNGLIPVLFFAVGTLICVFISVKKKTLYTLALGTSGAIFLFMILTLHRNTPIQQPSLSITNILKPLANNLGEFNIRYGLIMLPIVAIMSSYLYVFKKLYFRLIIIGVLSIQLVTYFYTKYTFIYQLPYNLNSSVGAVTTDRPADWLRGNYSGGLILISALKHDPTMLRLGLNYNRYIHEGTQVYWKDSLVKPQKYATWILMYRLNQDAQNSEDPVTKAMYNNPNLDNYYDLVYTDNTVSIYKIKTLPEIQIKN